MKKKFISYHNLFIFLRLFMLSFVYFFFLEQVNSNDVIEKLKILEKKLEDNAIIEDNLKHKQKNLKKNIKKIENILKRNAKKISIHSLNKETLSSEITLHLKEKKFLEEHLFILNNEKRKILHSLIKKSFNNYNKNTEFYPLLVTVYKNAGYKINLKRNELGDIKKKIVESKKNMEIIETRITNISSKLLEKSNLETSLQGENIITIIQRKEKELENLEFGKKAIELKKLIESLKGKSNKHASKKRRKLDKLKKIEDILPIKIKNIEKMRTDRSKKGILLTLKNKSFLTTPHDGLVVYADAFKGYGNMIIIDLGNDYHLIYSGLTKILCSVGDWVNGGKVLGEIENKSDKSEMYLEVRFKGKTVNPSSWIKS